MEVVAADTVYGLLSEQTIDDLEAADVVIIDVTNATRDVMYALGLTRGIRAPVIVITKNSAATPNALRSYRVLRYDEDSATFRQQLAQKVRGALVNPQDFAPPRRSPQGVDRLFISYSHRDRVVLDRLLVHLKPLEREGVIDPWSDTQIVAGTPWQAAVEDALQHARAAILLVSADFLASDFIVDNELPPLLDGAGEKGALIVPLIIKPCRYVRDPRLRHLQAINDPSRPLTALPEVEQEQLLDLVAATVESAMARTG